MFLAASGLRMLALDGDAVVFNPFSWETHLLNPAAAMVLERAASPCSKADVADMLAEVLEEGERLRAAEHAERVLADLLGLRLLVKRRLEPDAGR